MLKLDECVIIGGGHSIENGIRLGLRDSLVNKFVITCNYAFRHFDGSFLTFIDRDFYFPKPQNDGTLLNPNIYEELKGLPLIVGINHNGVSEFKLNNTILLQKSDTYQREKALKNGFYTGSLTGIFSLTLASFLMNYEGIIYLSGFDWPRRDPKTVDRFNYSPNSDLNIHYYKKEIPHRGVGYVGMYENHNPENYFKYFKEKKLKIYNVSPESNIETFEKISYEKMFTSLNNETYNQEEITTNIKQKLT